MSKLYFTNNKYKNIALNLQSSNENIHSSIDAFFLLIKGINIEDLSNLCKMIQQCYASFSHPIKLSIEDCYKLTQNNDIDEIEKSIIVQLATQHINNGNNLGNNTINNGKINTSSWLSHSFYVGEVCSLLASKLGLDEDKARTIGLLHDYGRKFNHTFLHVIKGFEELVNLGWKNEAIGCLTHSFVNGGRCSNNEPAIEGFYVDENGNARWHSNTSKDDITVFLENYKYTDYDVILNIADLMATSEGIVSPKQRLDDIATRRIIDPINRGYFLADITNTLIDILKKMNLSNDDFKYIKADKYTSLEQIQNYFDEVSKYFYDIFTNIKKQQTKKLC